MAKLEEDIENPEKSALFSKYPKHDEGPPLLYFVCDTLRTAVAGVVAPHDLDALVESDIEIHHHESSAPVRALTTVADALPGLGIVAAVLGIVITMGALGGLRKKSAKRWRRRWWGRSSEFCFRTAWSGPWRRISKKSIDAEMRILPGAARRSDGVCERHGADDRGGVRAPGHPSRHAADVQGNGSDHARAKAAAPRQRQRRCRPRKQRRRRLKMLAQGCAADHHHQAQERAHGGGHHGGAWKVAYADFVTAMMALFIVLWLLSSSEQVQESRGRLFHRSDREEKDVGNGLKGSGSESLSDQKRRHEQAQGKLEQAIKELGRAAENQGARGLHGDRRRPARGIARREKADVFRIGQPASDRFRQRPAENTGRGDRKTAEPRHHGGPHGFAAVLGDARVFELGALGRPGERGPALDAGKWHARRSGHSGAGFADQSLRDPAHPE